MADRAVVSAAEEVEQQSEDGAEQQARSEREVDLHALALPRKIAWQATEPGKAAGEGEHDAQGHDREADQDQSPAEIARRIHPPSIYCEKSDP